MKEFLSPYGESLEQSDAYSLFARLGARRSMSEVARQTKHSSATIGKWRKKFEWDKRVLEAEGKAIQKGLDSLDIDLQAQASTHLGFMNELVLEAKTQFDDGNLKINNVRDLTALINSYSALLSKVQALSEKPHDEFDEMTEDELRQFVENQEKKRTPHDRKVIDNFRGFESGRVAAEGAAGEKSYQEAQRKSFKSVHASSGASTDVPLVKRKDKVPQWRKSQRQNDSRRGGDILPFHGELSNVVFRREQAS